jgi:outer membrane protein TolC
MATTAGRWCARAASRRGALSLASTAWLAIAPSAARPPAPPAAIDDDMWARASTITLSVEQAVRRAHDIRPERAALGAEEQVFETLALEERALYDPLLSVTVGRERVVGRDLSSSGNLFDYETDDLVGEIWLTQPLPIGPTLTIGAASEVVDASADRQQLVEARLAASLRQPLLRGSRPRANLGRASAARHEARAAAHTARSGAAELAALVAQVGWDLVLAREQIAVLEAGEEQARALLRNVAERVESGLVARDQLVAAESEIALRHQASLEGRLLFDTSLATLAGYLARPGAGERLLDVVVVDALTAPAAVTEPVDVLVAQALRDRPEIAAARALVARAEVEVQRTRHGLLPRLDLVAEAAAVGYGTAAHHAWGDVDGDYWRVFTGVSFEHAVVGRDGRADARRESVRRQQALGTLAGLERTVEAEVRTAHAWVVRSAEVIAAVARTRALDEAKLDVELVHFDLGQASSFQVARAQRDLVERRLDELEAIAEGHKALVELERATGQVLARMGLAASQTGAGRSR